MKKVKLLYGIFFAILSVTHNQLHNIGNRLPLIKVLVAKTDFNWREFNQSPYKMKNRHDPIPLWVSHDDFLILSKLLRAFYFNSVSVWVRNEEVRRCST